MKIYRMSFDVLILKYPVNPVKKVSLKDLKLLQFYLLLRRLNATDNYKIGHT